MKPNTKAYRYFDASAIADQNPSLGGIDEQGLSLPWEMRFFGYARTPDITVAHLCARSGGDELLLIDAQGSLWRYYADIGRLQKSRIAFDAPVLDIESLAQLAIVRFAQRLEARALSNGQIVWSRVVSPDTRIRKADDATLLLYEASGETFLLNGGGEILETLQLPAEAQDVAAHSTHVFTFFEENGKLYLDTPSESFALALPAGSSFIGAEIIAETQIALLLGDASSGRGKMAIYHRKAALWQLEDAFFLRAAAPAGLRRDGEGRLWWRDAGGTLGFAVQERQYLVQDKPLRVRADSQSYGTRWHRLLIDYDLPDECALRIEAAASETPIEPLGKDYTAIEALHPDLLLPDLKGRYLFLRLYLTGDQAYRRSPRIRSIRVIYPRTTWLEYLPACYREDTSSAAMLERFLSIFETLFASLETKRQNAASLIDAADCPEEHLDWLSAWLGLDYDERWDEARWRTFLREAPGLFRIRGTREGIARIVELYSGMRPLIYEPMHAACQQQEGMADMDNFSFCLFLHPEQYRNAQEVETIRDIVDTWKPAYTKARVVPLENRPVLGSFLFLGVNTKLQKGQGVLGEARMPFDTLAEAGNQDIHTLERVRIGKDAVLH